MGTKRGYNDAFGSDDSDNESGWQRNVRARGMTVGSKMRVIHLGGMPPRPPRRFDVDSDDDVGPAGSDDDSAPRERKREPLVERSGYAVSIKSTGRGQIIMPQAGIVGTCRTDSKGEYARRITTRDKDMLVPGSLTGINAEGIKAMPGDLAFGICSDRDPRFRNDGFAQPKIHVAVNGLKQTDKIFFVGVVQGDGEGGDSRRGDDAVAIKYAGSDTIVNTGPSAISAGEEILADELPYFRRADGGIPVSVIEEKGQPVEKLRPALYAVRSTDIEADLQRVRTQVENVLNDKKTYPSADDMLAAIDQGMKDEDVRHGSVQSLRHYAIFYFATLANSKDVGKLDVVQKAAGEQYSDPDVAHHQGIFGVVAGKPDDESLRDSTENAESRAVLTRCMQRAVDQFRDRLRRRRVGRCIKGGAPGQPLDVIFGYSSLV